MLNSIQILRAIAAWIVVLHHYLQITYNFTTTDPISVALHRYGSIGVDLFFVISGFVIFLSASQKTSSPFEFAAHRIARIAPAYWVFTSLTAAILIYAPGIIPLTIFEPAFYLKSLFFIPALNPSGIGHFPLVTVGWTLNYEMAFYTVFFFSLFLPAKLRIAALFVAIIALRKLLPELGGAFEFYKNKIVYEFLFGVIIGVLHKRGAFNSVKLWISMGLLSIAMGIIFTSGQVTHSPFASGIPCALIVIAALSLERSTKKMKWLNSLGNWSYSTYLCHIPIICLMLETQKQISIPPALTLFATLLFIALVSAISFKFVESPIAKAIKKKHTTSTDSIPARQ